MKRIFSLAFAGLMAATVAPKAEARDIAYRCQLSVEGEAKVRQFLIGKDVITTAGDLTCENKRGQLELLPVRVKISTLPVGLNVQFGKFKVLGETTAEIRLLDGFSPYDLLGVYAGAQARASILRGVGVISAVKVGVPSISVQLGIQILKGFGVQAQVATMDLELDDSRLN